MRQLFETILAMVLILIGPVTYAIICYHDYLAVRR